MKALTEYILRFGDLSKQQTDLIESKAKLQKFQKDEYFSEAGKIPKKVGFILEGIFRFSYYNNKGEDITTYFIEGPSFLTDYQKFEDQIIASENIQAVTDSTILVFTKNDWDEILNAIEGWDKIAMKMYKNCMAQTIERRNPLVSEDATTRYLTFIEQFPLLTNRIPLSHIASYLGITQQSLSRIRRNIR
jgi:CRP-like cAMP-binding protein